MNRQETILCEGNIFAIHLGGEHFGFGKILSGSYGFYDFEGPIDTPIDVIAKQEILFKIWVADYALRNRRWKVLGNWPLSASESVRQRFFKKDPITGTLTVTYDGTSEEPVSQSDCEGLEMAAVWEAEHVEDRLRDHFAGRPNKWHESMRP